MFCPGTPAIADLGGAASGGATERGSVLTKSVDVFWGYLEPEHDGGRGFAEPAGFGPALHASLGRRVNDRVGIAVKADVQSSIDLGFVVGSGNDLSGALLLSVGTELDLTVPGGPWVLSVGAGYAALHLGGLNEGGDPCGPSVFVPCFDSPERGGSGGGWGYRVGLGWNADARKRLEGVLMELRTDGDWMEGGGEVRTRILQLGFRVLL